MPGYWNSKSDIEVKNEITQQLSIKSLDFIGRYRKHMNGFTYFDNIRLPNFSPLPKIKSNKDDKLANTKVITQRKDLKNGMYYHFEGKVIPQNLRVKHNNEFIFTVDDDNEILEYKPDAKDFIDSIYNRFDKADSANNNDISKALNTITYQINKKPETFIYEILQNADDNAGNKDVINVTFFITEKYLLISHNGEPFKFNNVFAICSVNAEDKSDDIDKIGFKGIGFKSVFKDNDWVFINSGEFSFRFDQSKYSVEKPWQLMPIWTPVDENLEISLRKNERFLSENVSIALRPKDDDIKLLSKYSRTLELFNDDRILLFLKKVRQVHVSLQNKEKIHCRKNNDIWGICDYTIGVDNEIKIWLNEQIRNNNQEVPIKYQDIDKFKISYAYKVDNNKVLPLVDSTLFNYLPLSISLGFSFLVNSDFIPDGDREELYLNTWNEYLMIEIGRNLPVFISDIVGSKADCFHLLPEFNNYNFLNSKWNQLYQWFLKGYVDALKGEKPIAFIPTKYGYLETLSSILIDETRLAELLGEEFSQLTGISEKLINNNVGEGVEKIKDLIKQNGVGVIYDKDRLKDDVKTKLQDWLKLPLNNFKFIEHLISNDSLKSLLDSEDIILSSNGELCKVSNLFAEVPDDILFLLPKKVNAEVLNLIKEKNIILDFKKFEPIKFLSEVILGKEVAFNVVLNNEQNLLYFWQFVFDNWEELESDKAIVNCLKSIEILCKSSTPDLLLKCEISKTYLAAEYNFSNEIESTVRSIIQDAHFISGKYIIKSGDEIIWRKIFNKLGVIGDLQKTIGYLLPKLSSIDDQQHFIITKQIFKYWKDNKEKETRLIEGQLASIRNNLKLKCNDDIFRLTSESIISDHYQTNKIIDSIFGEVSLPNQITSDYASTQISEWNTFFKEIGCIPLEEKQKVFDAKLMYVIKYQNELQKSHHKILKGINALYSERANNGLDFDFVNTLSRIKLKTTNNEFRNTFDIHFSSIYKPKIDIQNDGELNESEINFLSSEYFELKVDKKFLIKIGVSETFRFYKKDLRRDEIPAEYKAEFESRFSYIIRNAEVYGNQHRLTDHIDLNYKNLLKTYKYSTQFWEELNKPSSNFIKYLFQESIYKTAFNSFQLENYIINYLKNNEVFPNQLGELKLPSQLYSYKFSEYISDKSVLPKYDFSELFFNDYKSKSLENILGFKNEFSAQICIELLSRKDNYLTIDEISNLRIVENLFGYKPSAEEKELINLPDVNFVWKPISQLFFTNSDKFELDPNQQLHEHFNDLAKSFGICELSDENLTLKTHPELPSITEDVISFFKEKAKFIAFKIDQINWAEIESIIIEHFTSFKFYEVELVSKVFPKEGLIYQQKLDFHYDEKEKEVHYIGFWKNNRSIIELLYKEVKTDKINKGWFDNIINRWDNKEIINHLVGDFPDVIPPEWMVDQLSADERTEGEQKPLSTIKEILPDASDEEIAYISGIINISRDKDGQIDANTTAKIKTLKYLKANRDISNIADKGLYLQVDSDKIIVRSAQKGLLYLDLYDWGELNDGYIKIAIYTSNEIMIFDSQEDLFKFCKPQNTFGVLRMPVDCNLDDYNNLDDIKERSKWHFVFIVNKDAKAAKSYEELLNLDDYNF